MATYAECMKKLNLSNEEFGKVEESAMRFQEDYGMDPNEAFLSAIESETKALQSGRTKYINEIVNQVGPQEPRKGFAEKTSELTQVETKKPKAKKKVARYTPKKIVAKAKEVAPKALHIIPQQELLRFGDESTSPWLLTDGSVMATSQDHLELSSALGYEGYNDVIENTGSLRASFIAAPKGHEGKSFVSIQNVTGNKLTKAQLNTVKKFLKKNEGVVIYSELPKGSKPLDTKPFEELSFEEFENKVLGTAPKKKTTPVFKKPTTKTRKSIEGKLEQARVKEAEDKTVAFLEAEIGEVQKTLEAEAQARAENIDIPVEEPTAEFIVQNREAATRAIKTLQRKQITGPLEQKIEPIDASVKKNKDGTFTVSIKVPDAQLQVQDFDAPAAQVAQQTAKVFDMGRATQDRMVEFVDTNKKTKPKARVNMTELVNLGAVLSGKPIDYTKNLAKQVRDNLNEGMAYLLDKGYTIDKIPDDTVVYGKNITLGDLGKVSKEIGELSRQLSTLENTRPRDELFEPGNEQELADYYERKRDAKRALAKKLQKYGIEEKDAAFTPEDIIDEAGVVEGQKPHTFANLTPEYVGKGTKQRRSKAGPDNKVEAYTTSITPKEVNYTVDLLKHLGIKTNINFIDEKNIGLVLLGLEHQIKEDPANAATYQTKIEQLEWILVQQPKGRIEYFDSFPNVTDRVPTIFISNKVKGQERVRVITHELGHLVQRVSLDQAPAETQKMFREAAGNMTPEMFQEWFANQLLVWATNRQQPKSMIEKFFKGLAQQLKKLFNYITKHQPLNETYAEFMDAMVSAQGQRDHKPSRMKTKIGRQFETEILDFPSAGPFMLRSGMNQSADFTPMTPSLKSLVEGGRIKAKSAFEKFNATKVGNEITHNLQETGQTFLTLHDKLIRSADARLRAMNTPVTTWLANQWHHRPGEKHTGVPIPMEIRQRGARFHTEIERISREVMPRIENKAVDTVFGFEHGRLDKSSQTYNAIGELLVSEKVLYDKDGNKTELYYSTKVKLEAEYGRKVADDIIKGHKETRDYLDDLYDYLTEDLGLAIKRREAYFPHALDTAVVGANKAEFIAILKAETKMDDARLEEFYNELMASDGTLMDLNVENQGDVLGPSFKGLGARVFEPALVRKLQKFYIKDPMSVLTTYTHSAIKRGVIQKRFNPNNEMSTNKLTGKQTFDPMYELNKRLDEAEKSGELSPEQAKTSRKIIEAYLGRLGASMDPKLRNMSALMVTYQNMRLLSFVVLSSVVDAGFIDARAGAPFTSLKEVFKLLANKDKRAELYAAADMIGAIRDDITEHIVNDQQSMTYMSHRLKAGNEAFFRLVRMHQWTNLSRVMSLSAGKSFLLKHANSDSAKSTRYLEEVGLTKGEILEWGGDLSNIPPDINSALNQFIDESVIRPDAALRPVWASDPHWAIFWHLKQFMWAYHEVILRRLWAETKNQQGLSKAIPLMLLATATLPLAAAGYELRRWIGHLGDVPEWSEKQGGDYFWEVVQRSGAPGILQLYVDADEAEEHGQFAPMALLGPTMSQVTDFLTKDFGTAMGKSLPFVAQMPAVRSKFYSD